MIHFWRSWTIGCVSFGFHICLRRFGIGIEAEYEFLYTVQLTLGPVSVWVERAR